MSNEVLLIADCSGFVHRRLHVALSQGIPSPENDVAEWTCGKVLKLAGSIGATHLIAAFDRPEAWTWRHELDPSYKAHRPPHPPALLPAMRRLFQLLRQAGALNVCPQTAEADDAIAFGAWSWGQKARGHCFIASSDKDLLALLDDRTTIIEPQSGECRDEAWLLNKMGLQPWQIRSYLALVGDAADGIPGIPQIGPKTAVKLLVEHGSWEAVSRAEIPGSIGETIRSNLAQGELSYRLAELRLPPGDHYEIDAGRLPSPHIAPAAAPRAAPRMA